MKILFEVNSRGTTVIMVTHDKRIIERSGRRAIFLEEGRVVTDTKMGGIV